MIQEQVNGIEPAALKALDELRGCILRRYPDASFAVSRGPEDPSETFLTAMVDVDDTDEVVDAVIDRLLEMQTEDGLPIYFLPMRPAKRLDEIAR